MRRDKKGRVSRTENSYRARRGGGGRSRRSDLTGAVRKRVLSREELEQLLLSLLVGDERHGYELIRAVKSLSKGAYAPSSGMVYPALASLEEESLISETETEAGRRMFIATGAGREKADADEADVKAIKSRLAELGAQDIDRLAPVERALTNLEMVIERAAETVDVAGIFDIAALIDAAAQKIERMELERDADNKPK